METFRFISAILIGCVFFMVGLYWASRFLTYKCKDGEEYLPEPKEED